MMRLGVWICQRWEISPGIPRRTDTPYRSKRRHCRGGQNKGSQLPAVSFENRFYVLDYCFSALDYSTDKEHQQNHPREIADRGVLVIAQRVRPFDMLMNFCSRSRENSVDAEARGIGGMFEVYKNSRFTAETNEGKIR